MHRVVWGLGGGTLCHRAGRRKRVYTARKDSPGRATSTRGKRDREPSADFEASMHFAASIAAQSLLNRCSPFSWSIFPVRSECSLCRRMCSRDSTCHGARLCFIERDTRCQQRPDELWRMMRFVQPSAPSGDMQPIIARGHTGLRHGNDLERTWTKPHPAPTLC